MKLLATSRPADDVSAASHTWEIEAETYEQALERARAEVAPGSRLLFVRIER